MAAALKPTGVHSKLHPKEGKLPADPDRAVAKLAGYTLLARNQGLAKNPHGAFRERFYTNLLVPPKPMPPLAPGIYVATREGSAHANEDYTASGSYSFKDVSCRLFALFDGHSGGAAAYTASQEFGDYFLFHLEEECKKAFPPKGPDRDLLLTRVFKKLALTLDLLIGDTPSGSTFLGVAAIGDELYVASTGDSVAYLIQPEEVTQISYSTCLGDPLLADSIWKRGGEVVEMPGSVYFRGKSESNLRLAGINMARTLGDKHVTPIGIHPLSPKPKITKVPLPKDGLLFLCSDGVDDMIAPLHLKALIELGVEIALPCLIKSVAEAWEAVFKTPLYRDDATALVACLSSL